MLETIERDLDLVRDLSADVQIAMHPSEDHEKGHATCEVSLVRAGNFNMYLSTYLNEEMNK